MVCLSNECSVVAVIRDTICSSPKKNSTIQLTPSTPVLTVFNFVAKEFHYSVSVIELVIQNSSGATIILNPHLNKTLGEIGVVFDQVIRNTIVINTLRLAKNMTLVVNDTSDDDLILGASASPTTGETSSSSTDLPLSIEYTLNDYNKLSHDVCNFRGLVNQAMTCYLNSLLQALYMTPEFRNALYNWEFDGIKEEKSIPYQLQRLFLNLQTSKKSAIETTELTRSFGWDLSEAWQQHDIQELCRVMFDALEQKFKDTRQANFINDLYEGKMLDYVKCLDCGTEKSREDTFLDIPLPVRPFGCNKAYSSVEEALRAFVQPETLDGNNQYHCEKCNKKCDAHKGFKFIKFPYLLTLHLKRFDFDYATMHRIKLNDKVVFPEQLNLNSFVTTKNCRTDNESSDDRETAVKCDDCSTTDSGSALDDEGCQFNDVPSNIIGHDNSCLDDDEGIDVSSGNHQQENEKNHQQEPKGPYNYELFSIMIHSGSASGGHYYAYIKDFEKNQWFCFNDQTVSRITEDDIHKTYGGGPLRVYYSGAYSSSTNAYMLMYRQIDKERNCSYIKVDEFPVHIKRLLHEMRVKEERERALKERENDMFKIAVFCWHPIQNLLLDKKIFVSSDMTLKEAAKLAHQQFQLDGLVDQEDCRLVAYNKVQDSIGCSFETSDLTFCDMSGIVNIYIDWLLDIKQPGTEFQVYKLGGITMKVFYINLDSEEVDSLYNIHINVGETVIEVKRRLAQMLHMECRTLKLVQGCFNNELQYLEEDDMKLMFDSSSQGYKLYVADAIDEDRSKPFHLSKMNTIIDCFVHVVTIEVFLPDTDTSTLETLCIPPLDMNQNLDKTDLASGDRLRSSPQPIVGVVSEGFGDQSNSEDSSLSESDRTLVGDAPGESTVLLSSSSNSPADQHMASPTDPTEDSYNHEVFGNPGEEMNWDDDTTDMPPRLPNYYFKVMSRSSRYVDIDSAGSCIIQVDKRMTFTGFKKNLEPIVGVPMEYFKIFKQNPYGTEWIKLNETLHWVKDNEKLHIKLGRILKANEHAGKVFHLTLENSELSTFLFEWVIAKGQTVGQIKKEILLAAKKRHLLDIAFNKSRLRLKEWKVPGQVYLDDQKFGDDIPLGANWEIYLQDLGEGEKVTNINQLCLFVKRWCPSTLTLTPFHEVVLNAKTMDELKRKLSEESDIPKEFVEVAALKESFPCDMNILDIQDELEWNTNVPLLESWPLHVYTDGKVFLYRDSREKLKEITPEERKEINRRETSRLVKRLPKATYGNRKERALKIYLDSSPKKTEDGCGD